MPQPLDTGNESSSHPSEGEPLPESLGIKDPLLPHSPLGQNFLYPKFLSPLGARSLAVLDCSVFSENKRLDRGLLDHPFQDSPFFSESQTSQSAIATTVQPVTPKSAPTRTPFEELTVVQFHSAAEALPSQAASPTVTELTEAVFLGEEHSIDAEPGASTISPGSATESVVTSPKLTAPNGLTTPETTAVATPDNATLIGKAKWPTPTAITTAAAFPTEAAVSSASSPSPPAVVEPTGVQPQLTPQAATASSDAERVAISDSSASTPATDVPAIVAPALPSIPPGTTPPPPILQLHSATEAPTSPPEEQRPTIADSATSTIPPGSATESVVASSELTAPSGLTASDNATPMGQAKWSTPTAITAVAAPQILTAAESSAAFPSLPAVVEQLLVQPQLTPQATTARSDAQQVVTAQLSASVPDITVPAINAPELPNTSTGTTPPILQLRSATEAPTSPLEEQHPTTAESATSIVSPSSATESVVASPELTASSGLTTPETTTVTAPDNATPVGQAKWLTPKAIATAAASPTPTAASSAASPSPPAGVEPTVVQPQLTPQVATASSDAERSATSGSSASTPSTAASSDTERVVIAQASPSTPATTVPTVNAPALPNTPTGTTPPSPILQLHSATESPTSPPAEQHPLDAEPAASTIPPSSVTESVIASPKLTAPSGLTTPETTTVTAPDNTTPMGQAKWPTSTAIAAAAASPIATAAESSPSSPSPPAVVEPTVVQPQLTPQVAKVSSDAQRVVTAQASPSTPSTAASSDTERVVIAQASPSPPATTVPAIAAPELLSAPTGTTPPSPILQLHSATESPTSPPEEQHPLDAEPGVSTSPPDSATASVVTSSELTAPSGLTTPETTTVTAPDNATPMGQAKWPTSTAIAAAAASPTATAASAASSPSPPAVAEPTVVRPQLTPQAAMVTSDAQRSATSAPSTSTPDTTVPAIAALELPNTPTDTIPPPPILQLRSATKSPTSPLEEQHPTIAESVTSTIPPGSATESVVASSKLTPPSGLTTPETTAVATPDTSTPATAVSSSSERSTTHRATAIPEILSNQTSTPPDFETTILTAIAKTEVEPSLTNTASTEPVVQPEKKELLQEKAISDPTTLPPAIAHPVQPAFTTPSASEPTDVQFLKSEVPQLPKVLQSLFTIEPLGHSPHLAQPPIQTSISAIDFPEGQLTSSQATAEPSLSDSAEANSPSTLPIVRAAPITRNDPGQVGRPILQTKSPIGTGLPEFEQKQVARVDSTEIASSISSVSPNNVSTSWSNIAELLGESTSAASDPTGRPEPVVQPYTEEPLGEESALFFAAPTHYESTVMQRKLPTNDSTTQVVNLAVPSTSVSKPTPEQQENNQQAATVSVDEPAKQEAEENFGSLEDLARQVYWLLQQRFGIERERRQGLYYSGRLPW